MEKPTPDIGELRSFSQEHMPEERKQVAADIKEERSKYFSEKESLAERIKKLEAEAADQEARSGNIAEKIDALRQGISQKESGWLSKVVNFFELKKLRQELGARELTAEKLSERMAETGAVMSDLQELIQDKSLLKKARARLLDFKGEQTEAWQEYRENESKRDIKNIMREQDVVFIHGTHPSYVPQSNSILKPTAAWQDKLRINFALEPTVSASTIKPGDGVRNYWARMGLLLKGGRVDAAQPADSVSRVNASGKRKSIFQDEVVDIGSDIRRAISERSPQGYNEFILQDPEFAGMFYSLDDDPVRYDKPNITAASEFQQLAADYGVPLYVVKAGKFFEAEYNPNTFQLEPGKAVSGDDIANSSFQLDVRTRQRMTEEIIANRPFEESKIEIEAAENFSALVAGSQTYLEINAVNNPAILKGAKDKYQSKSTTDSWALKDGDEIESLMTFNKLNSQSEFFKKGNQVFQRTTFADGRVKLDNCAETANSRNQYISMGAATEELPIRPRDSVSYMEGVNDLLKELNSRVLDENNPDYRKKFSQKRIDNLCLHLHGFADTAEKFGDSDIAARAREMAAQFVPDSKISDFKSQRLTADGGFKMLTKDLPGYGKKQV